MTIKDAFTPEQIESAIALFDGQPHDPCGPSSLWRVKHCNASAIAGIVAGGDGESEAASEGTRLHELLAQAVERECLPCDCDETEVAAGIRELQTIQQSISDAGWKIMGRSAEQPIDCGPIRGTADVLIYAERGEDKAFFIVDWKTGEPPSDDESRRHAAVQLAVYRLAWAALSGIPEERVNAAFHYVRSGRTVIPEVMPGPRELAALLV